MKGVSSGVHEYRIDSGPGYRIYFGKDGDRLVILLEGEQSATSRRTLHVRSCGGPTTRSAPKRKTEEGLAKLGEGPNRREGREQWH